LLDFITRGLTRRRNYFFLDFTQKNPATKPTINKPAPRKDVVLVVKSAIALPVMLEDKKNIPPRTPAIAIILAFL